MFIKWQIRYFMICEQENLFAMIYSWYDRFGPEVFLSYIAFSKYPVR